MIGPWKQEHGIRDLCASAYCNLYFILSFLRLANIALEQDVVDWQEWKRFGILYD